MGMEKTKAALNKASGDADSPSFEVIDNPSTPFDEENEIDALRADVAELKGQLRELITTLPGIIAQGRAVQLPQHNLPEPHKASELSSLAEVAKIFTVIAKPIQDIFESGLKLGVHSGRASAAVEAEQQRSDDLSDQLERLEASTSRALKQAPKGSGGPDYAKLVEQIGPAVKDVIGNLKGAK